MFNFDLDRSMVSCLILSVKSRNSSYNYGYFSACKHELFECVFLAAFWHTAANSRLQAAHKFTSVSLPLFWLLSFLQTAPTPHFYRRWMHSSVNQWQLNENHSENHFLRFAKRLQWCLINIFLQYLVSSRLCMSWFNNHKSHFCLWKYFRC
jgi:hypothetical protein